MDLKNERAHKETGQILTPELKNEVEGLFIKAWPEMRKDFREDMRETLKEALKTSRRIDEYDTWLGKTRIPGTEKSVPLWIIAISIIAAFGIVIYFTEIRPIINRNRELNEHIQIR